MSAFKGKILSNKVVGIDDFVIRKYINDIQLNLT